MTIIQGGEERRGSDHLQRDVTDDGLVETQSKEIVFYNHYNVIVYS